MKTLFNDIETAMNEIKRFRTRELDSLAFELLDKMSSDNRLIEAAILIEELFLEDCELALSWERQLILAKLMGYEVSGTMGDNFLFSFNVCDNVAVVANYLAALAYLSDYGIDDCTIV